jgi:hypothetical protein
MNDKYYAYLEHAMHCTLAIMIHMLSYDNQALSIPSLSGTNNYITPIKGPYPGWGLVEGVV